ncbi:VOC family protein [Actinomadura atramentaria]|uniref:VOC family protein n=1 Tax=Actinomadura atramentaria TaxID=1990 RepID=UPI000379466B|nr:VOC family protein [Actinomadura atramentaria]
MKVTNVVYDCTDLDEMARFWSALIGMKETSRDEDWIDLEPLEGGPILSFQLVPEGKTVKNRVHLDLAVPDVTAAAERARSLGATLAVEPDPGQAFQVWRDPQGNEFCLCAD